MIKEKTYSDKLKSPLWQQKRLKIMERDKFTCMLCTDKESSLHVHHKQYTGEPWEAPDEDLETLCCHCHRAETEMEKNGDTLIFAMKTGTNYFGKTKKGLIIIGKIMPDDSLIISLVVNKPKEFLSILNTLI